MARPAIMRYYNTLQSASPHYTTFHYPILYRTPWRALCWIASDDTACSHDHIRTLCIVYVCVLHTITHNSTEYTFERCVDDLAYHIYNAHSSCSKKNTWFQRVLPWYLWPMSSCQQIWYTNISGLNITLNHRHLTAQPCCSTTIGQASSESHEIATGTMSWRVMMILCYSL